MSKRVLIPFRYAKRVKAYAEAAAAGGCTPVPADVRELVDLSGAAGLLLMGGSDVNPLRYHEPVAPETEAPDDGRDRVELELIDEAIRRDLPILAICRGLQILNVYHGGTLIQHVPDFRHHDPDQADVAAAAHEVAIEEGSLLRRIAGCNTMPVNSRHHQAAGRIGDGLEVVARDPEDQIVEALERRNKRFVVAVQWHPEDQVTRYPEQLNLFRCFAEAL